MRPWNSGHRRPDGQLLQPHQTDRRALWRQAASPTRVFLRRPVICAPRLMLDWLAMAAELRHTGIDVDLIYQEGDWVGAGEPIVYLTGSMVHLSDLETILLQKIGPACVAAHNAYQMALSLPDVAFLAMEARHCAGAEMQDMMSYAASVGSAAAQARGRQGLHRQRQRRHRALVRRGARLRHHAALADRLRRIHRARGGDVSRDLSRRADDRAGGLFRPRDHRRAGGLRPLPGAGRGGELSFRLDTHGGRFLEGLDPAESYAVLERYAPGAIRRYRSDSELRSLVGTGVSAAAIWRMREASGCRPDTTRCGSSPPPASASRSAA